MHPQTLTSPLAQAVLRAEYFARSAATHVELVESSARPASSVFQIRVRIGHESRLFWVKVRRASSAGTGEDEFNFLERAHETFGNMEDLGVPRPVAYLQDFDAIVIENVEGSPLQRLTKKSLNRLAAPFAAFEEFERHFARCGAWLAKLHEHVLPSREQFDPSMLHEYVDVRLASLEASGALSKNFRARVTAYLDSLLLGIEPDALVRVWSHGDYAPYNVIVSRDRMSVIDPDVTGYFAELRNHCSRYEDVVHFHRFAQSMSMTSGLISPRVRERLARCFLEGYEAAAGQPMNERSAAYRAFRVKYELLSAVGMRWPSLVGKLLPPGAGVRGFRRWFERACRHP